MSLLSHLCWGKTRADHIPVDAKLGELKYGLGVLRDFDLRGGVDVRHGWGGVGRGEILGAGGI